MLIGCAFCKTVEYSLDRHPASPRIAIYSILGCKLLVCTTRFSAHLNTLSLILARQLNVQDAAQPGLPDGTSYGISRLHANSTEGITLRSLRAENWRNIADVSATQIDSSSSDAEGKIDLSSNDAGHTFFGRRCTGS